MKLMSTMSLSNDSLLQAASSVLTGNLFEESIDNLIEEEFVDEEERKFETKTVKYLHKLNKKVEVEFYGKTTLKQGMNVIITKYPQKLKEYSIVMGHGSSVEISPNDITVYALTRKSTTEITLDKVR